MGTRPFDEQATLDRFYQDLDLYLRLFGAEELGKRNVFVRLARTGAHARIDYAELRRILARVTDFDSWYPSWAESAAELERLAQDAERGGHRATAGEAYLRAALRYHFGQLLLRTGSPQKDEGRAKRVACYRQGSPYYDPPAEPVAIPFAGTSLPGYLRLPRRAGRVPCVMILDGADSVKEEYHNWSDALLGRGLATLTFDGPGQGEMAPRYGGRPLPIDGYEAVIAAVIDYLAARPEIDPDGIGGWGVSLGGHLVLRAAGADRRLRAAVSLGGFYDCRDFPAWPLTIQLNVHDCLGFATLAETRECLKARCTLRNLAAKIDRPYLVVHGAKDDLTTVTEARQMVDEGGGHGELVLIEDGLHVCFNRHHQVTILIADWLEDRLSRAGAKARAGGS